MCIRALSLDHSSSSWGCRSLRQLLLILVLEALSRQFRTGVPWELNYADDLVLIVDTQEECITKRKAWKAGMKSKGSMSTWRRPRSWYLVLAMMSSRNLASSTVLHISVVSATTPCSARIVWYGSTSRAVAQLSDWWPSQTVYRRFNGKAQLINGRTLTEVDIDGTVLDV